MIRIIHPLNRILPLKIVFCTVVLFLIISFISIQPCRAANEVVVAPEEPFALWLDESLAPDTNYSLKLRFSNNPSTCAPSCKGQTWQDGEWLGQSASWAKMPAITSDDKGKLQGFIVGQLDTDDLPSYLQLAVRTSGSTNTKVIKTWASVLGGNGQPLTIVAYDATGNKATGIVSLTDNNRQRYLPFFTPLTTHIVNGTVAISLVDSQNQPLTTQTTYKLSGNGFHKIIINPPPETDYAPKLLLPDHAFASQTVMATIATNVPYLSPVNWYSDGAFVGSGQSTRSFTWPSAGVHKICARLSDNELAEATINITSYGNILMTKLLPNPVGSDSKSEQIELTNNNPFDVVLADWLIKSRSSSSKITINTTIHASSATVIQASNFLRNNGSTYDLYNESNQLVDTVSYTKVNAGDILLRNGLIWETLTINPGSTVTTEHQIITGTVVNPSGKTFDLQLSNGQAVHVVVHSSFDGLKPRLYTGDLVRVAGEWHTSKNGRYISIRAGDFITVVKRAPKKVKTSTAKTVSPAQTLEQALVPVAKAQTIDHPPPLTVGPPADRFHWLYAIAIVCGVLLLLPFERHKPV